ncbi:VOC family protein [Paraburkholderia oxyphila]|uniref:VOC family protein n=1 Tax=Paraburkholderia oxyphila TaxID=614212 RepID=UPI000482608B|nr:VOC family protein [Paraburkholderia oxyphila]
MIRSLNHVGLIVPSLEIGRAFYECAGLETRASGRDLVCRCEGRDQDQIRLIEGPKKRLAYVSFGTHAGGLSEVRARLEAADVEIGHAPVEVPFGGIWFKDPDGDWINVQEADDAPSTLPPPPEINAPQRYRRIGVRACDVTSSHKRARPRRLGHLIKFSPDVDRAVRFYSDVLGLLVSDRALDILAFMRSPFGGDHHMLGIAKSSHTGLHHLSFEVGDIDEIEMGAQHLLASGYKDGFGFGRHGAGSNYFHYVRDPWNSLIEYFWDIDVIPEGADWTPMGASEDEMRAVLEAVWSGTPAPKDFIMNFEEPD